MLLCLGRRTSLQSFCCSANQVQPRSNPVRKLIFIFDRFGDSRNKVPKKQAEALEKQSSAAVVDIRSSKAEGNFSMAEAKNTAFKAGGWAASIHPMLRTLLLFDGNVAA